MFNECSHPKLWDGQKKMKLFWWKLCCCFHFICCNCLQIDSRRPSTFTYGAHFCVTFMVDFISFIITDFVSLHTIYFISHVSFHCTSYFYNKFYFSLFPDSCCLDLKFRLVTTSIADFILVAMDITDFILTFHVTVMAFFI